MKDPLAADSTPSSATDIAAAGVDNRRLTIVLCATVAFLYWVALYLYVPTLPTYAQSKSDSLALVGLVLSMYGLWQAVIRLPVGILSDWMGRRKLLIVIGLALEGLGAWMMGATDNVSGLLIGRSITGLACGTWVPLTVLVSSFFPPREAVRVVATLTLLGSVAKVLATGVTGSLNELGGYSLAFFLAAAAAALAILLILLTREYRQPPKQPSVRSVGTLVTRRDVLLPAVLNAISQYALFATTFGFLPILARQLGATDVQQSVLVSINMGAFAMGNLAAVAIAHRIGTGRLIYLSFGLLTVAIVVAAIAPTLSLLFFAQFGLGLAQGMGFPILMGMSIQEVPAAERATAMGLHQSVYAIGMFGGPWLSGILADAMGIRPMFGITAFLCLALGFGVTRWLVKTQQ